jgi:hypothetical protein
MSDYRKAARSRATHKWDSRADLSLARNRTEAAQRALDEARAREGNRQKPMPKEVNGRDGPEPTRFGDWEVKGLATDF